MPSQIYGVGNYVVRSLTSRLVATREIKRFQKNWFVDVISALVQVDVWIISTAG
jgi:hypothetical protein